MGRGGVSRGGVRISLLLQNSERNNRQASFRLPELLRAGRQASLFTATLSSDGHAAGGPAVLREGMPPDRRLIVQRY